MVYILLFIGFGLLLKGADCFVEGSSSVASIFRVPTLIIGLTIVAFGTSAPELAVSISAVLSGSNGIAAGNVIGSNLFNLLVALGICAVLAPMPMHRSILRRDYFYALLATGFVLLFALDGILERSEGIFLLIGFAFFMGKTVHSALRERVDSIEMRELKRIEKERKIVSLPISLVLIAGGLLAIMIGGNLVVDSAGQIAERIGLSERMIGLTVVAVGTSLPELLTSVVASRKGENGLALGNVIGSNLFNLLFILGSSASLMPIGIERLACYDTLLLIAVSVLIWFFARKRYELRRRHGVLMVAIYISYMIYMIVR